MEKPGDVTSFALWLETVQEKQTGPDHVGPSEV